MKQFAAIFFCMSLFASAIAQLYINGGVYVQKDGLLFSEDSVLLASSAIVFTEGIIQSGKGISTNGRVINTGTTGFIISPILSSVNTSFDIGTSSNSKIHIQHSTGSIIVFQLAVREGIFKNPETNSNNITDNVVGKTWIVRPLSTALNCTSTLGWNKDDELGSFSRLSCATSKWTASINSGWSVAGSFETAINTGSAPAYSLTTTLGDLPTNSTYLGIGGRGSALPLPGLSFRAATVKQDVFINWKTFASNDSKFFYLERSIDGIHFITIATLNATLDNSAQTYNYTDAKAFTITNSRQLYYRLKQAANDGQFSYSEVRAVSSYYTDEIVFAIYPNPANNLVHLKIFSDKTVTADIAIYNGEGKRVLSKSAVLYIGPQLVPVNISHLSKGVYQIKIAYSSSNSSTQKLIIQ